ncbi:MAG: hypothetical protein ACI97A_002995 [Planctomycetota bacterium]|jgi:hypothetical protein
MKHFILILAFACIVVPGFAAPNGGPKGDAKPLAHIISIQHLGGTPGTITHPGNAVTFVYNQDVNNLASLTNVEAGSTLQTSCSTAAMQWENISALDFTDGGTVATADANDSDGMNLVTFVNSAANNMKVGGALAIALSTFNVPSGDITDSDIIFNSATSYSTLGTATRFDVGSVAAHEFGHTFGLNHSPMTTATMFPVIFEGSVFNRSLSMDDIAGVNNAGLYQGPQHFWSTGSISGMVTQTGQGTVYGAHVVARSVVDGTTRASAISLNDGTYSLTGLPIGPYIIYIEPLDGPCEDSNVTSSFFNNTGNGYLGSKNTTFPTTFLGGIATPTIIRVQDALVTTGIDINAAAGASTANLRINKDIPGGGGVSLPINRPGFEKTPGDSSSVFLAGPGAAAEANGSYSLAGQGVTLDTSSNLDGGTVVNGSDTVKQFSFSVAADAEPGPRDLVMSNGAEISIYSGLIDVAPAGSPPATSYSYGTASAGSAGTPVLSAVGIPTIPSSGFALSTTAVPMGEVAFFFGALRPDYVDFGGGLIQWLRIPQADLFPSGGPLGSNLMAAGSAGVATLPFPIPNIPNIDGLRIYMQVAISDPGAGGLTSTNALVLRLQL